MSNPSMEPEEHDVVISGGGPVGLTLALGLARAGLDVLVLEREATTGERARASVLWPGTQDVLAELGVGERFAEAGICLSCPEIVDADRGTRLLSVPMHGLGEETLHPRLLILPQSETERLLYEEIRDTVGVEVRFCAHVSGFIQDSYGVDVAYRRFGHEERVRAKFVAGCDGAHSAVRRHLGGRLEGRTYTTRTALADIRLSGRQDLAFPRFTRTPRPAIAMRLGPDLWRLIFPYSGKTKPDLETWIDEACAPLFGAPPEARLSTGDFHMHRRVSSQWVNGRIVLAGNAAHLNSSLSGEGLNVGIEDAELLTLALVEAVSVGHPQPLAEYVTNRRRAVESGVNTVTDMFLRLLLTGGGWMIRPAFAVARTVFAVPALRRTILRRLAFFDRR